MRRIIIIYVTLILVFFVSATTIAKDLRPRIDEVIKNIQIHQLCGEYISDGGIYDKFVFGDGNQVTIDLSGMEFVTTYFINEKSVLILTDKQLVELSIVSPSLLTGKDTTTTDRSYARKNIREKSCSPYLPDQTERTSLNNQLCFLAGIELLANNDREGAYEQFLACCNSGDGRSCYRYGFLKYILENDQEKALKYFKKACDLGYIEACVK